MFDVVGEVPFRSESEAHLKGTYINQLWNDDVVCDKQRNRCKLQV